MIRNCVFSTHPFSSAGRICVFQCYLDDSYDQPGTGVVTLGGYFGGAENWCRFEERSDEFLTSLGVPVFHSKDFKNTNGVFRGWSRSQKEGLSVGWFNIAQECGLIGVSKSVKRSLHKSFRKVGKSTHNYSPLGMAFGAMSRSVCDGSSMNLPKGERPTSFFVESGNANNSGVKKVFDSASKNEPMASLMRSLTFVRKDSCRAIQLADFCAYYSRQIAKGLLAGIADYDLIDGLRDEVKIAFTRVPHAIEVSFGHVTQDIEGRGKRVNVGQSRSIWVGPQAESRY